MPSNNERLIIALLLVAACSVACDRTQPSAVETREVSPAQQTDDHAPADEPAGDDGPGDLNPVQHEMRLLTVAMKNSLDAIANDNLSVIPAEIAKVHPAKVATGKALEAGTYKTPHSADKMQEFAELDEVFHDQLRVLLASAKKNDTKAAAVAYSDLVEGCANCHAIYRFPPRGNSDAAVE